MKPRKRRRKKHYKTGLHTSQKLLNGPAKYRSGWELQYMKWLDDNLDVESYIYEGVIVGYVGNKTTGKIKHYYPDLLVKYVDGTQCLVEIKPDSKVDQVTNKKKFAAAKVWCADHNANFVVVTETTLKQLNISLQ